MQIGRFGRLRVSNFEFRVLDSGSQISGFGFRVSGFEFRVSNLRFGVSGFGFRISGLRSRVLGLWLRVPGDDQLRRYAAVLRAKREHLKTF